MSRFEGLGEGIYNIFRSLFSLPKSFMETRILTNSHLEMHLLHLMDSFKHDSKIQDGNIDTCRCSFS